MAALLAIIAGYVVATELLKHWFYTRFTRRAHLGHVPSSPRQS